MLGGMISVLLPVRNASGTLDAALESLWRQTREDFEVLAVDDGSSDEGPEILMRHAAHDSRLRVTANRGEGLVDALETGRNLASFPYLARFDADDLAHPDRFRLQAAHLDRHPEVTAVGSRVVIFPRTGLGPGWRRYEDWLNGLITPEDHDRERFVESPLAHPSVMMRAEAVSRVGGYRDPGWAEDYDLWLRLLEAGGRLAKVDRVLLGWRHTGTRHSVRAARYTPDAFLAARAHFLARHPALEGRRVRVWGAGRTGRRLAHLLGAEGVRVLCFYDVDESKIGGAWHRADIHSWRDLAPPDGTPLLVAVGAPGARELIRPEVVRAGYREGIDAFFAG